MASELTLDRARELVSYDPDTGVFTWNVTRAGTAKAGNPAGTVSSQGYVDLKLDGRRYKAHRVAWLLMTGAWPVGDVDHRDGSRLNNRWKNLRDASRSLNMQNQRRARRGTKSGLLGVTPYRRRWVAQIGANGRTRHIGVFDTPEAAHAAYLDAKRRLHAGNTL